MREETEVIPLRPGFDNEFRGFNRNQVIEHIEMLEDQIKMLTMDRDEAARLNEDQRRITDHTRRQLEETTAALDRMQNSDTGLPHATHRMQNMLMMADDEARTIREHARREAETIRGTAQTDAAQMRTEAETMAMALRDECNTLVADMQTQREKQEQEYTTKLAEISNERRTLERSVKEAYDQTIAAAEHEAAELIRHAQQRKDEMETASLRYHEQIMHELNWRSAEMEKVRETMLESLEALGVFVGSATTSVKAMPRPDGIMRLETPVAGHGNDNPADGHPANEHAGNGHAGNGQATAAENGNDQQDRDSRHHVQVSGELNIPAQVDSDLSTDRLSQRANARWVHSDGPTSPSATVPTRVTGQPSAADFAPMRHPEEGN